MAPTPLPPVRSDCLVIGSGLAGLYFALRMAEQGRVRIVTKHRRTSSNTRFAQGGISAVFDERDSVEKHVNDTLKVGAGLADEGFVRFAVERAPELVRGLANEFGARFDREEGGEGFALGREGGHTERRVVHHRDTTGAEIERALIDAVEGHTNIEILEHHDAIDLLSWKKVDGTRGCFGAYVLDIQADRVRPYTAPITVLATGGAGKVYRYTSNPDIATGDGIAMAYRIGAQISNLEFMQFHPTCLHHPDANTFLISEALRGEGGILRTESGEDLMADRHPMGSLAPRDVVAREIDAELKRSGARCVYLDMRELDHEFIVNRFPGIHTRCISVGIDMREQMIPVVPAAHYMCGGVVVDRAGQTSVPGLLAVGEVAMSGMHGACRLASNSLLEAVVLAASAAEQAGPDGRVPPEQVEPWNEGAAVDSDEAVIVSAHWEEVRALMWNFVGIVRSDKRLARALRRLELIRDEIHEYYWRFRVTRDVLELRNITLVGRLIVEAAMRRKESRGLHYTLDYKELSEDFAHAIVFDKYDGGPRA